MNEKVYLDIQTYYNLYLLYIKVGHEKFICMAAKRKTYINLNSGPSEFYEITGF
jgi:hypothetical protein